MGYCVTTECFRWREKLFWRSCDWIVFLRTSFQDLFHSFHFWWLFQVQHSTSSSKYNCTWVSSIQEPAYSSTYKSGQFVSCWFSLKVKVQLYITLWRCFCLHDANSDISFNQLATSHSNRENGDRSHCRDWTLNFSRTRFRFVYKPFKRNDKKSYARDENVSRKYRAWLTENVWDKTNSKSWAKHTYIVQMTKQKKSEWDAWKYSKIL